jgi:putative aldouronate transport system substrate-binding protein
MSSDEGYYLLGWGKEGVNYVLNAEGVPTGEGVPNPDLAFSKAEMQPLTQLRSMVFFNGAAELRSRYPTYTTAKSGKKMSSYDVLADMQSRKWTPVVGSDALPVPGADLKRFNEQGIMEFLTGTRQLTPENWKAWVAEFDKMGGLAWEQEGLKVAAERNLLY